jgi:hypothetical protein
VCYLKTPIPLETNVATALPKKARPIRRCKIAGKDLPMEKYLLLGFVYKRCLNVYRQLGFSNSRYDYNRALSDWGEPGPDIGASSTDHEWQQRLSAKADAQLRLVRHPSCLHRWP